MTEIAFRVDLPVEHRGLYASCVSDEGFVDVNEFIEKLPDVKFEKMDLGSDISGVLEKTGKNTFRIIVNKKESEERQRFTAAHELGHYFLHRDFLKHGGKIEDRYILKAKNISDEKEAEANQFASAFLIPLDKVVEVMQSGKRNAESLADHFGVSIIAMANRLGIPT